MADTRDMKEVCYDFNKNKSSFYEFVHEEFARGDISPHIEKLFNGLTAKIEELEIENKRLVFDVIAGYAFELKECRKLISEDHNILIEMTKRIERLT